MADRPVVSLGEGWEWQSVGDPREAYICCWCQDHLVPTQVAMVPWRLGRTCLCEPHTHRRLCIAHHHPPSNVPTDSQAYICTSHPIAKSPTSWSWQLFPLTLHHPTMTHTPQSTVFPER